MNEYNWHIIPPSAVTGNGEENGHSQSGADCQRSGLIAIGASCTAMEGWSPFSGLLEHETLHV